MVGARLREEVIKSGMRVFKRMEFADQVFAMR